MKIKDILAEGRPTLSFEVFPPKTEANYESVEKAALEIGKLHPSFMSVTYGAGGGTSKYTVSIADKIQRECGVPTLAHLTCVSSTREHVHKVVEELKEYNIENIMALRGDIPKDGNIQNDYRYASELIREIRESGDFCIGAACYPEGHPEAGSLDRDIVNTRRKIDSGCDFLVTQMVFDNNIIYNYMYRLLRHGIDVPVVAGIMPVTNAKQINRICELSGTKLPANYRAIVEKFADDPEALKQAGIAYATGQIVDLIANGLKNIHVYTMNRPEIIGGIMKNLSEIVK